MQMRCYENSLHREYLNVVFKRLLIILDSFQKLNIGYILHLDKAYYTVLLWI